MIWSRYNYLFKSKGACFLYNTLSNSFAELDDKTYEYIFSHKSCVDQINNQPILYQQLCDMKAIVENDDTEFKKIKFRSLAERFSSNRLELTINPTLDCNFACPYCFESSHNHIYMTEETENKIIGYIKQYNNVKEIRVTWFGGEPLLAFRRIDSLSQKLINLGVNYRSGMITNGYLLNRNIIEKLNDLRINSLQITLDGLADIHNHRRFLKNGGATFDRIISNIDMVNKISPQTKIFIRVNIDKSNMENFIDLFKFFQDKQYNNLSITPAFVDDVSNGNRNPCIFNQRDKMVFVRDMLTKYGLDFSLLYPSSARHECAVRNPMSTVIGPEGELYKCWNDVGNKEKIYGFIDGTIVNEALLLQYLLGADPFEDNKCVKCRLLPVCSGGCPYNRIVNLNKNTVQDACPLQKKYLKSLLTLHYDRKNK